MEGEKIFIEPVVYINGRYYSKSRAKISNQEKIEAHRRLKLVNS